MEGWKKRKEMEMAAMRREEFIRRHEANKPVPGKILQFRKDENV